MSRRTTRTDPGVKARELSDTVRATRFSRPTVIAAPAIPRPLHRYGDLDSAPFETLRDISRQCWPTPVGRRRSRDRGIRVLTDYLLQHPGSTWQQRWDASELGIGTASVVDITLDGDYARAAFSQAVGAMYALRVLRPTLPVFRAWKPRKYVSELVAAENDPALVAYIAAVNTATSTETFKRWAIFDVCTALTTQGIPFADLTPEAFLHYAQETRGCTSRTGLHVGHYVGHLAWQVLHSIGHFPANSPPTLRGALRSPQFTTTEMVDRHNVANPAVRQLFIDYLDRRSTDVVYSTLTVVATHVVKIFWKALELINPAQSDLRLSEDHYRQWHATLAIREDGTVRQNPWLVLTSVKAFYYDIQAWAVDEPERWAHWSAPCPIQRSDMRSLVKHQRRTQEQTHHTIRTLQPLLPVLVDHVDERYTHWRNVLERASTAAHGEHFTQDGQSYTRVYSKGDDRLARDGDTPGVHVRSPQFGRTIDAGLYEDAAFWTWSIIETLRHSGMRIEELTELSQLSVRQYQRPNGEVIALLVIAPSKSDRERVIPMSAELFHVIACVIRRITHGQRVVPLATRYDDAERSTSEPQPFLFQRRIGQRLEVMTTNAIGVRIRKVCEDLAETDPRFAGIHFRPHDFRRLFATDLVNNGLPIHIGAALLGHLDLNTTRGYVAVFEEDVTRHYQAHLQRRRALRPVEEYQPVTDQEWAEFETHFDKRKVELGSCGRPYATPCTHEHACIRCPMLRIDPKMLSRLAVIETDLEKRRERAHAEGWVGEIEGIDLTLTFLRTKRDELHRMLTRTTTLGIPVFRGIDL
ncbi:tyrosine-type recombinase/integrase [Antrihabitans sp. NCIMB 15449]|uniref:Tyrosine-type recombinase/integrase n=1 Tax=Antrihabitans spumae TaxID=3373370 RepID=A0ABW7JHY5_9NOCA